MTLGNALVVFGWMLELGVPPADGDRRTHGRRAVPTPGIRPAYGPGRAARKRLGRDDWLRKGVAA